MYCLSCTWALGCKRSSLVLILRGKNPVNDVHTHTSVSTICPNNNSVHWGERVQWLPSIHLCRGLPTNDWPLSFSLPDKPLNKEPVLRQCAVWCPFIFLSSLSSGKRFATINARAQYIKFTNKTKCVLQALCYLISIWYIHTFMVAFLCDFSQWTFSKMPLSGQAHREEQVDGWKNTEAMWWLTMS